MNYRGTGSACAARLIPTCSLLRRPTTRYYRGTGSACAARLIPACSTTRNTRRQPTFSSKKKCSQVVPPHLSKHFKAETLGPRLAIGSQSLNVTGFSAGLGEIKRNASFCAATYESRRKPHDRDERGESNTQRVARSRVHTGHRHQNIFWTRARSLAQARFFASSRREK